MVTLNSLRNYQTIYQILQTMYESLISPYYQFGSVQFSCSGMSNSLRSKSFETHKFLLYFQLKNKIGHTVCHVGSQFLDQVLNHISCRVLTTGQPRNTFLNLMKSKIHEQQSLVGYGPLGCKELDMTERLIISCVYSSAI